MTVAARRVPTDAGPSHGIGDDFTYTVLAEPLSKAGTGERRGTARRRTRLHSGKVVSLDGRFVVECLITNLSAQGGLLRLPSVVPLAPRILVYADQSGELTPAVVVWRRGRELGIRFALGDMSERHRAIAASMRRKFYAVPG